MITRPNLSNHLVLASLINLVEYLILYGFNINIAGKKTGALPLSVIKPNGCQPVSGRFNGALFIMGFT